jgi:hypothetical protein
MTGGSLILASTNSAAFYIETENQTLIPSVSGAIEVSASSSGDGKVAWNSSMGLLASNNAGASLFRYVEFLVQNAGPVSVPQAGDNQDPLLWLGIGLITLSGMGALLCVRCKRRA